ncbi:MAG: GNAT family N-acetyltransferase [Candidatus Aenigmarchaeota archaeon]|nr:GNAT family N-acetyltransferase [Candidatus Aenigmarchaeota archaeon]
MVITIKTGTNHSEKVAFVKLTREYFIRHEKDFFALECNWTALGETPWTRENFLMEIPLKWKLSFAAEIDGRVVGYIIGSRFDEVTSRVNKIVVGSEQRRTGIGKKLLELYIEACKKEGIRRLELKALTGNNAANMLYEGQGYTRMGTVPGTDGLMRVVYERFLDLGDKEI